MKSAHEERLTRFGRALGHPCRVRILVAFLTNDELSPIELARRIDVSLGNVSYHVRFLASLGMLELRHTEAHRSALQHFYVLRPEVRELLLAAVAVLPQEAGDGATGEP